MLGCRFLLDANISPETASFLRSHGFVVKSLLEDGLGDLLTFSYQLNNSLGVCYAFGICLPQPIVNV